MSDVRVDKTTAAPPAQVWARVVDGARWPELSPLGSFELERPGTPEAHGEGVGAIRLFTTGRVRSREEVVERVEERRFAYVLLSGLPIRDYRAELDLEPTPDGGTRLRWHSSFRPKVPGTGWLLARGLARTIEPLVAGLASE